MAKAQLTTKLGTRITIDGTSDEVADLLARLECGIRGKAATDSDGRRPSIPIESDHPIRTKAATLLMG